MLKGVLLLLLVTGSQILAADSPAGIAATAINSLGIELLAQATKTNENAVVSPYSIQTALAMTYAGAAGMTRDEMAKVLHYETDETVVHRSFASLQNQMDEVIKNGLKLAEMQKKRKRPSDTVTLSCANRLFGQTGYDFQASFLNILTENYVSSFQLLDFAREPKTTTQLINTWVENQTHQRIQKIIPEGAIDQLTRLVLVNAIYFKAPWGKPFEVNDTKPRSFRIAGSKTKDVPTMVTTHSFGYGKFKDFCAIGMPYSTGELQFLILLPDKANGLPALEHKLNDSLLRECAHLKTQEVMIYLPKLRIEPRLLALGGTLRALGMKSAFDEPHGSANFERIAPRRPDGYLYLSEVFHKTFVSLDEKGTEAAAATAVVVMTMGLGPQTKPRPIKVHVDHPFLFAIQHCRSGACLFLGRVTDPR